jgi:histidyl-tRNA synthetase
VKEIIQKPRGTKDILPDDEKYWRFIENTISKRCQAFDFGKIETPMFESSKLYTRAIGENTDIVEKEMYEVRRLVQNIEKDGNDETLVLRPEFTAGIVRAYIEKGMFVWPQPVKLYSFGPVFRYDRPQKGRYRQFNQFNLEVLGNADPLTDVVLLLLTWQIFSDLGLKDEIVIEVNSIGCKNCRSKIKKTLINYFKQYKSQLCEDCQRRLENNPLRVLDCKKEACANIATGAPQIIDLICVECKDHFKQVLEGLDDLEIPYDLNPKLVRGLDYYTRTTFEIRDIRDESRQSSLAGGGRYDNLVELYGGKNTPAIGIAGGVERIIEKIKEVDVKIPEFKKSDIFIVQIGESAKKIALKLIYDLGEKGFSTSCSLGRESLKSQLKAADKTGAKLTLIIGQREVFDKSVIIKNMAEGSQETIEIDDLDKVLLKYFKS